MSANSEFLCDVFFHVCKHPSPCDITTSWHHIHINCNSMRFTVHNLLISENKHCKSHWCPTDTNENYFTSSTNKVMHKWSRVFTWTSQKWKHTERGTVNHQYMLRFTFYQKMQTNVCTSKDFKEVNINTNKGVIYGVWSTPIAIDVWMRCKVYWINVFKIIFHPRPS